MIIGIDKLLFVEGRQRQCRCLLADYSRREDWLPGKLECQLLAVKTVAPPGGCQQSEETVDQADPRHEQQVRDTPVRSHADRTLNFSMAILSDQRICYMIEASKSADQPCGCVLHWLEATYQVYRKTDYQHAVSEVKSG